MSDGPAYDGPQLRRPGAEPLRRDLLAYMRADLRRLESALNALDWGMRRHELDRRIYAKRGCRSKLLCCSDSTRLLEREVRRRAAELSWSIGSMLRGEYEPKPDYEAKWRREWTSSKL